MSLHKTCLLPDSELPTAVPNSQSRIMPPAHPFDSSYLRDSEDEDKLKEECGIFGVVGVADLLPVIVSFEPGVDTPKPAGLVGSATHLLGRW